MTTRWRSALVPHVQHAKTQCRPALVQHGPTATTMLNLKQLRSLCVCMCSQGSICAGQRHACTANIQSCEHKYISHIGRNSFSWDLTTANTATNPATECVSLATPTPRQLRATLYLYTILYTLIHYTIYYTIYYTLYTIHYTLYTYTLYLILIPYTLYIIHLYLYLIPYTLYLLIPYTLYIYLHVGWRTPWRLTDPMEADGPHRG